MCLRKLFPGWFKPEPVTPDPPEVPAEGVKKTALLFAINDYPGSQNDLNGCLNDQRDVANKLNEAFPGFTIRKFSDAVVTKQCYKNEVAAAISCLKPGATVIIMADSCFSGTITKAFCNGLEGVHRPTKNRFYRNPELPVSRNVKKGFAKGGLMRWITLSGCQENQTSADAYINGEYHGAFTFYAMKVLKPGMTYRQWHEAIRKYLPSVNFDQAPGLEGPDELLDRKVFDGEVLLIHNSSHGTQVYDQNDDESDGYDEAICVISDSGTGIATITDDEINALLTKIP
jgi:hypothetical protein